MAEMTVFVSGEGEEPIVTERPFLREGPRPRPLPRRRGRLRRLPEPEPRTCRDCGDEFVARVESRGSKWTDCCPSCLAQHL